MKWVRWSWIFLLLAACAQPRQAAPRRHSHPAAKKPQPVDSSACRQTCQRQLLDCGDSPVQCDQRYSRCLSRC